MEAFPLDILPALSGVLGVLLAFALESKSKVLAWFHALSAWGKFGAIIALCLAYGLVLYFGVEDLQGALYSLLALFLGSQVGHQANPGRKAEG